MLSFVVSQNGGSKMAAIVVVIRRVAVTVRLLQPMPPDKICGK